MKDAREEGYQEGMEQGVQKGIEKGIEKGTEQGKKLGIEHTVRNVLDEGMEISLISKVTGMTEDDINKLK